MELDLEQMTDDELYDLVGRAESILGRRQTAEVFEAKIAEVVKEGRAAGIIETPEVGEEWQAGHVYSLGDVVTLGGKRYESIHPYNSWRPGDTSNPVHWTLWKLLEEPEEGETGYVLWSGLGVKYAAGDVHEHDGQVWEALQAHTSQPDWAPGTAHSLWKLVADENGDDPEDGEADELPDWKPNGHPYEAGDVFTYNGEPYRVRQAHTSQSHWTPDTVASLYEKGSFQG